MKKYLILLCGALLLIYSQFGCNTRSNEQLMDIETIEVNSLKKVSKLKYDDKNYFDNCFLVKLETTEKSLINEITQIQILDSIIYIFDQKLSKISSFSYSGKYLGDIGVKGQGPEEYIAISSFYVDRINKSINLIDPMNMAIIQYSMSGAFLNRLKHSNVNASFIKKVEVINENELFCYLGSNWEDNSIYSIVNRVSFEKIKDICYYPQKTNEYISYSISNQPFSFNEGLITYGMLFSDVISTYETEENKPFLRIDDGKKIISSKYLEQQLESENYNYIQLMRNIAKENNYVTGFLNVVENSRFIVVDFETKETIMSAIIWDKKGKKGIYVEDYWQVSSPDFGLINFYDNNLIVKIWKTSDVMSFKSEINKNIFIKEEYPDYIEDIINEYGEDNNPILVFYKLKV